MLDAPLPKHDPSMQRDEPIASKGITQFEEPHEGPLAPAALFTPLAIIFGSLIIAASVLYSENRSADVLANNARANGSLNAQNPSQAAAQQPAQPDPNERVTVSTEGRPSLGRADAKVTVVEFSDLQCPFCKKFHDETFAQLKTAYIDTGKIRFVYRHLPLTQIHQLAAKAAEGAECAFQQGKFWEMHDAIFAVQPDIGTDALKALAKKTGLSAPKFDACLDGGATKSIVDKDAADGSAANISGTPTFFVNGKRLVGAQPFSAFQQAIDSELAS